MNRMSDRFRRPPYRGTIVARLRLGMGGARYLIKAREWSPFEWSHIFCPIVHPNCGCMEGWDDR